MLDFNQLKKNLKKDYSKFKKIKIALLGDTATQLLVQAIKGVGYEKKYHFDIWEADYNQIERHIFDQSSDIYNFYPDVIIIFQSSHKLLLKYNKLDIQQTMSFSMDELHLKKEMYLMLKKHTNAKIIFYNYSEIDDSVFGSYAMKIKHSFIFQLRKLNFMFMEYAAENSDLYLCDISSIQNLIGRKKMFHSSIYINSEVITSLESLPSIANKTADIIASLYGNIKKCLILDLDNTLWGGVIGDDGIENIEIGNLGRGKAFSEFQYWIKKLKNRGIILTVCSKNTESIAKEPFEKHPDMILKLDDFAVFMANWNNKVDNIRQIQNILNIGYDSMIFLDDNPFERNMVKENIPEICIPELPEDPAEYLEYLYSLNLFETTTYSTSDSNRTTQYQNETQRINLKKVFVNEDEYLKNLNMGAVVDPFNSFNTPRVAQLSQRSNQFNLRTIRYTEDDIKSFVLSNQHYTFAFSLEDKFGNNGLISVIILKQDAKHTLFIDTWMMSCRVLKRGMENFTINTIVNYAKKREFKYLKGEYIPTTKNNIVKNIYKDMGFTSKDNYWLLCLDNYEKKKSFIKKINK